MDPTLTSSSAESSGGQATSNPSTNDVESLNLNGDDAVEPSSGSSNKTVSKSVSGGGNKVLKMHKAMDRTVEHCLNMLSYSVLKKHLLPHTGEANKKMKHLLRSFQEEMVEKIRTNIKDEIKLMMDEEKIVELLDNFETFLGSVQTCKQGWRPTGDPEKDVAAHLIHTLVTTLDKFDAAIAEEKAENDQLFRAVRERRRLIENLKRQASENQKLLVENIVDLEDWVEKVEDSI